MNASNAIGAAVAFVSLILVVLAFQSAATLRVHEDRSATMTLLWVEVERDAETQAEHINVVTD